MVSSLYSSEIKFRLLCIFNSCLFFLLICFYYIQECLYIISLIYFNKIGNNLFVCPEIFDGLKVYIIIIIFSSIKYLVFLLFLNILLYKIPIIYKVDFYMNILKIIILSLFLLYFEFYIENIIFSSIINIILESNIYKGEKYVYVSLELDLLKYVVLYIYIYIIICLFVFLNTILILYIKKNIKFLVLNRLNIYIFIISIIVILLPPDLVLHSIFITNLLLIYESLYFSLLIIKYYIKKLE